MAPIIPKRRRTERPHEIQERPPKIARRNLPRSVNGREDTSKQSANVSRRDGQQTFSHEDESSESDEEENMIPTETFSSLLGALKVPISHYVAPQQSQGSRAKANGNQPSVHEQLLHGTTLSSQSGLANHGEANGHSVKSDQLIGKERNEDGEDGRDSEEDSGEDPFVAHFARPNADELSSKIKSVKSSRWRATKSSSSVGRTIAMHPESSALPSDQVASPSSSAAHLKQKLRERGRNVLDRHKQIAGHLAQPIFAYKDVLYGGRTTANAESMRSIVCLHALNHVLKTRDVVIKNNARLAKDEGMSLELRDQGFTRPKVLILLETRQMCVKYTEALTTIFEPEQQENKKRFEDAFVRTEQKYSEDKPLDFRELFEGNDDNEFRLGVKFTRKTIKYYSQFYNSDIILASPLGLRRAIKAEDPKHTDCDFLSSIELFIIDQADAMLMQNFEHVEHVFDHFNLQPKEAHGCDFSRVRQWYLDGNARYLRQTVVLSAFLTPELNSLFSSRMQNVAGKLKITPAYTNGKIMDVGLPVRQTFSRFTCRSPEKDPDERFKYFVSTIIPLLARQIPQKRTHTNNDQAVQEPAGLGALIFIPSYLDFVRIRNHFSTSPDTANLSFGSISEYTEVPDARRTRSHFLDGRQSVMLYTGRAHHFHRYRIRGVKTVILYGIPENPLFYPELVGDLLRQSIEDRKLNPIDAGARILFSKYDGLMLERIIGSQRARRMLKDNNDTFAFT